MANNLVVQWMVITNDEGTQVVDEERMFKDFAGSIDLGVTSVPALLQELGPYLDSNQDLLIVARALSLVSRVFVSMQTSPSKHEIHAVVEYLCARVENRDRIPNYRAGLGDVVSALHSAALWEKFIRTDATIIARAIFDMDINAFVAQLPVTRLSIYELIDLLFEKFWVTLKRDIGLESLVAGVLAISESEKNPSCLRTLFTLLEKVSKAPGLGNVEYENIWEMCIRYFPITLRETRRDAGVPSMEELRDLLMACFIADDNLAQYSIPAMIDRLDTNTDLSAVAKLEVFTTLSNLMNAYSVSTLVEWSAKIWDSLKFEIWNGENEDFIEASLTVLNSLASSLSKQPWDATDNNNAFATFVTNITTECSQRFHDTRHVYLVPSGRILQAIGASSPYAFHLIIRTTLPALLTIWQGAERESDKKQILAVLNNIVTARLAQPDVVPTQGYLGVNDSLKVVEYHDDSKKQMTTAFSGFRDALVEVYHTAVSKLRQSVSQEEISVATPATKGLVMLFRVPSYLSPVEKGMIVEDLSRILLSHSQGEEIFEDLRTALEQIITTQPEMCRDIIVPNFMEVLPDKLSGDADQTPIMLNLQTLQKISCSSPCESELLTGFPADATSTYHQRNFDFTMKQLLAKLKNVLQQDGQLGYAKLILATILIGLETFDAALGAAHLKLVATGSDLDKEAALRQQGPYNYIVFSILELVVYQKKPAPDGTDGLARHTGIKNLANENNTLDDVFVQFVGKIVLAALRSPRLTPDNHFLIQWNLSHPQLPSAVWTLFSERMDASEAGSLVTSQPELQHGPVNKLWANALSMYLVAGAKRQDKTSFKLNVGNVAASMISNFILIEVECSKFARISMLWFMQLLVNKFGATREPIDRGDGKLIDVMRGHVENTAPKSSKLAKNTFQSLAYFTAASLACSDPSTMPLIELMLNSIHNQKHGRKVAQSFRILLGPSEILNAENFCVIRPLRKGRLYELAAKPLITQWRSATDKNLKDNCLIALAGILAFVDADMLNENVKDLFPVILEGTNIQDDDFAMSAFIGSLLTLVPMQSRLIEEHLDSIIIRMTDRTRNTLFSPSDASAKCRGLAVDVLTELALHLPPMLLIKRRFRLVQELDVTNGDISLFVRSKTDRCKQIWQQLQDPE